MKNGFTLIELAVTLLIIGILAAIAMPIYSSYIIEGKLVDAQSALQSYSAKMQQAYADSKTYGPTTCIINPPADARFDFSCLVAASGASFTATATNKAGVGIGSAGDYVFSIDQDMNKTMSKFAGTSVALTSWKYK